MDDIACLQLYGVPLEEGIRFPTSGGTIPKLFHAPTQGHARNFRGEEFYLPRDELPCKRLLYQCSLRRKWNKMEENVPRIIFMEFRGLCQTAHQIQVEEEGTLIDLKDNLIPVLAEDTVKADLHGNSQRSFNCYSAGQSKQVSQASLFQMVYGSWRLKCFTSTRTRRVQTDYYIVLSEQLLRNSLPNAVQRLRITLPPEHMTHPINACNVQQMAQAST